MRNVALPKVYLRELTLEDAEDTKPSAFFCFNTFEQQKYYNK